MGTRADFYVGRGEDAEYLGSIAWDGFPFDSDLATTMSEKSEDGYRSAVAALLSGREDGTLPSDGWPWPWDDSSMTDFAFAFSDGQVWASSFGSAWVPGDLARDPDFDWDPVKDDEAVFPFNGGVADGFTMGPRSGIIVVEIPVDGGDA